jgi:NFACT protein RNA binding domain
MAGSTKGTPRRREFDGVMILAILIIMLVCSAWVRSWGYEAAGRLRPLVSSLCTRSPTLLPTTTITRTNLPICRASSICYARAVPSSYLLDVHSRRAASTLKGTSDGSVSEADEDGAANANANMVTNKPKEQWNIKGLRVEVSRAYLRAFKKVGKASENLEKALKVLNDLSAPESQATLEQLEKCPDVDGLRAELNTLKTRLADVSKLEDDLKILKNAQDPLFGDIVERAIALHISDEPPPKVERPKKVKAPPTGPRLPYFVYTSAEGISIRVGRRAEDNDELSTNPIHRDGSNWWLHAQGYAGSHVVIRSDDDDLPDKYRETLIDAALLAAVNSKAPQSGKVPVSLVRCRQVKKPSNFKAGMVTLNGDVATVTVNVKTQADRLERLSLTKDSVKST